MWVDTTTVVPHIIDLEITEQHFRAWLATNPDKAAQMQKRRVEAHLPRPTLDQSPGEGFDPQTIREPEPVSNAPVMAPA